MVISQVSFKAVIGTAVFAVEKVGDSNSGLFLNCRGGRSTDPNVSNNTTN